jgi:hypothetical protein
MDFEKQKSTDEGKAAQVYASSRLKIQAQNSIEAS